MSKKPRCQAVNPNTCRNHGYPNRIAQLEQKLAVAARKRDFTAYEKTKAEIERTQTAYLAEKEAIKQAPAEVLPPGTRDFHSTRRDLQERGRQQRENVYAQNDVHLNEVLSNPLSRDPHRIHDRLNTAYDLASIKTGGHQNRVLKQILKLQKKDTKVRELGFQASTPEEQDQVRRLINTLQEERDSLNYDLDLLSTHPQEGDHPRTLTDREAAIQRWSLKASLFNR